MQKSYSSSCMHLVVCSWSKRIPTWYCDNCPVECWGPVALPALYSSQRWVPNNSAHQVYTSSSNGAIKIKNKKCLWLSGKKPATNPRLRSHLLLGNNQLSTSARSALNVHINSPVSFNDNKPSRSETLRTVVPSTYISYIPQCRFEKHQQKKKSPTTRDHSITRSFQVFSSSA